MRSSYACDYEWHRTAFSCVACPLKLLPEQACGGNRTHGLYDKWKTETNKEKRKQLAIEIASLEVKEGIEYA